MTAFVCVRLSVCVQTGLVVVILRNESRNPELGQWSKFGGGKCRSSSAFFTTFWPQSMSFAVGGDVILQSEVYTDVRNLGNIT